MEWSDLELRDPSTHSPLDGLALYQCGRYIANYCSLTDCVTDIVYHWNIAGLDEVKRRFQQVHLADPPFRYRGVIGDLYVPTEAPSRYVCFSDTITGIFSKFERIEQRAIKYEDYFSLTGSGIHLFNEEKSLYEMWVGGTHLHDAADVVREAKSEGKLVPDALLEELAHIDAVDVFISHKSEDIRLAKHVYDQLIAAGLRTFLSEISLPALANADYAAEIDAALDKASNMVVVADTPEKVSSGWMKYEWTSFANELRSGRKRGNLVVVMTENMTPGQLPFALRQCETVGINELERLRSYII